MDLTNSLLIVILLAVGALVFMASRKTIEMPHYFDRLYDVGFGGYGGRWGWGGRGHGSRGGHGSRHGGGGHGGGGHGVHH